MFESLIDSTFLMIGGRVFYTGAFREKQKEASPIF
jgi:hypothetical protein